MNILVSSNAGFIKIMAVTVYSLCKSNANERIDLYLAHRDMSEADLNIFRDILNLFDNKELHPIDMNGCETDKLVCNDRFSIESYYRIFALDFLPQDMDRILYLDGDMIVQHSLSQIYETELPLHCPFAVCEDIDSHMREMYDLVRSRTGVPAEYKCFNSGFMLINLNYMRYHNNIRYIKDGLISQYYNYEFHDQDILNHMFYDRVKYIPWEYYNLPAEWWYLDSYELVKGKIRYATYREMYDPNIDKEKRFINITENIKKNAVVIHYFGLLKPWIYTPENIYPDVEYYSDLWYGAYNELHSRVNNVPGV